jgi:membrane-anchored glycerophosphoryl diester phosphodiesterase (GDPDase)
MAKKHVFSAHSDLRTGFFCKFFLILGCILFILYLILILFHPIALSDDVTGAILAFSILLLGIGVILYFFSCQFAKLSQIAKEVESDESLKEDEEEEKSQ